jgi:hypothetical protein
MNYLDNSSLEITTASKLQKQQCGYHHEPIINFNLRYELKVRKLKFQSDTGTPP